MDENGSPSQEGGAVSSPVSAGRWNVVRVSCGSVSAAMACAPHFRSFFHADGSCTAQRPDSSLRTRDRGSPGEAVTVRPTSA